MAKRRKLSDLVKEETQRSEVPDLQSTDLQTPEVTELQSYKVTDSPTPQLPNSQTTVPTDLQTPEVPGARTRKDTELQRYRVTNLQTPQLTDSQTPEVPKYLTLIRKETRLREDQLASLTAIARKLNRTKRGGERITENTLIRVAVDLLLDRAESLSGVTEAELRDSLSSEDTGFE